MGDISRAICSLRSMSATVYFESCLKGSGFNLSMNHSSRDWFNWIRTQEGYNALHLVIRYQRGDLVAVLFYSGCWATLCSDSLSEYAKQLCHSDKNSCMELELKKYDGYFCSMHAIHRACLAGELTMVRKLIESDPGLLNKKDAGGATCLFYACASGNSRLVKFLLSEGSETDVRNESGETPLHIAALCDCVSVIDVLLERCVIMAGCKNRNGRTPADVCAMWGNVDGLGMFKERGVQTVGVALTIAARYKQWDAFDFLLDDTADVNAGRDEVGNLAIHYAVIHNKPHAVKKLLERGASISTTAGCKRNVFHLLAGSGGRAVMDILVDEAKTTGVWESLISAKADYPDWSSGTSVTPLHAAVRQGQSEVVRHLLDNGAKANETNLRGETPLHFAARLGDVKIFDLLIEAGGMSKSYNDDGKTPYDIAENGHHTSIMNYIDAEASLKHAEVFCNSLQRHMRCLEELVRSLTDGGSARTAFARMFYTAQKLKKDITDALKLLGSGPVVHPSDS